MGEGRVEEQGRMMPRDGAGFIRIALDKQCILMLTLAEYTRGLRRGKWVRRQEAMRRRGGDGR